jgi:pimeloyl-ACP methyl ester carboxylesterase
MFKTKEALEKYMNLYESCLKLWPVQYEIKNIISDYGSTQVIICGDESKPPLILLHGAGSTSLMWVPNILTLASKYRIYAIDTIGDIGKSKIIKTLKSKNDYANWLDLIISKLSISEAYIAGMSYGTFLALNLAITKPEKVIKLILIAPGEAFLPLKFIKLMMNPSKKGRLNFLKWSVGNKNIVENDFTEMIFIGMKSGKYYISPMMKTIFSKSELENFNIPVLLLVGENEVIIDINKLVKKAKEKIKNIDIKIVPNTGHGLSAEQPEIINNYINEFIKK